MRKPEWEQLTLYPEDSPASRFPWPESSAGRKTSGFYGPKCSALSGGLGRIASSVRMYLESSRLPPGRWSRIWSAKAITSSCCNLRLRLSELCTEDRASSLWGTPNTMDALPCRSFEAMKRHAKGHGRKRPENLREQVNPEMIRACAEAGAEANGKLYPTPRANEEKDSLQHVPPSRLKSPGKCNLTQYIALERLFTTPCAADSTGTTGGANHRSLRTDVSGQLNPEWVEWLMGFPAGWSALEPSAMQLFRSRHTRYSARSRKN